MSIAGSVRHQRRASFASASAEAPQDAYMAALIDSRCLSICISLLERVNGVSAVQLDRYLADIGQSITDATRELGIPRSFARFDYPCRQKQIRTILEGSGFDLSGPV
jgi:hypothetical protein